MKSSTNRGGHYAKPLFSAFVKALLPVMLLLVGNVAVKAQTEKGDFTFNDNVRYSQWVIESRLNDFYESGNKHGFAIFDDAGNKLKGNAGGSGSKNFRWHYVPGLVAKAVMEAQAYYNAYNWSKAWKYSVKDYAVNNTYTNESGKLALDNMNACKMYFPLMTAFSELNFTTDIDKVIADMKTYNKDNSIGGTNSDVDKNTTDKDLKDMIGGWFHKANLSSSTKDYIDQMWCDGLYMGPALLAQIINYKKSKTNVDAANDWDLIANQFRISWKQLYDEGKGLLYHGFTATPDNTSSKAWAGISNATGNKVYHSAAFWGRANGWYMLALVDVLEQMPEDNQNYGTLEKYLEDLATGVKKYQDDASGCWYQVMDKTEKTLTGNYLESSCTAIFTAAYLKAIRLGLLDKETYEQTAIKAYKGFVEQFMKYETDGTVQLIHNCASAGLGGSNKRSGSDDYYITGSDVYQTNDYTEGKVLGAFIMAATEYEKAYQNASVLFCKDLATSYELNAGESIKVEVSDDNVSYQWYDAATGKAISNATSASYIPTTSGSYYCVVTPPTKAGETIKSSTAEVTVESSTAILLEDFVATANVSGKTWSGYRTNGALTVSTTEDNFTLDKNNAIVLPKKTTISINVPEGYTVTSLDISARSTSSSNTSKLTINGNPYSFNGNTATTQSDIKVNVTGSGVIAITGDNDRATNITEIKVYGTEGGSTEEPPKSSDTNTTFGEGTLEGTTLTVELASTDAGSSKTLAVTLPANAKAEVTSSSATFADGKLSYTAPAAGQSMDITLKVTAEDGTTTETYTIKVSTQSASTGGETGTICTFSGSNKNIKASDSRVTVGSSTDIKTGVSATYKDVTYPKSGDCAVKMNSSGEINIKVSDDTKCILVCPTANAGKTTFVIGTDKYTINSDGLCEIDLKATSETTYTIKKEGSEAQVCAIELIKAGPSKETATTLAATGGVLSEDGKTLTITHEYSKAGQTGNITVTPAAKATYTLTPADDGATLGEGNTTITYTVPAAGTTKTYKLNVTAEDGTTTDAYTIKIVTNAAPGSMAEYTATFTLEQLNTFGSRGSGKGDVETINSDDNALTLEAIAGTTSGRNVEGTGKDNDGAKMQTTSSFILTPTSGVKIKKVSISTTTSKRKLTSTPAATPVASANDKALWEYTFNSIEEAITFKNENTDNINVKRINVVYEKTVEAGKTALSAAFSNDVLSWYVNDEKPTEPTLTVNAAGAVFSAYSVKYTSSNTGVVKVNETTGVLTQVGSGTAVITAEVTPTDETKYVGTSVVYTVNVKALEKPTVYAHDITIYNTAGVQPQPVVDVYVTDAEGNRIVLDKRYYTLSYAQTSGEAILKGDKGGEFILDGEAGNWTVGSAVVRVTCNPTDEAAMLYHIAEADATFNVKVVSAGDKLVPTLGGITEATMNVGETRDFVKAVLYDGVDITEGFTYNVETTQTGVSGYECSVSNGVITLKPGTNASGTSGTVTITITATPTEDYKNQYTDVTGTIVVTVGEYNEFNSVTLTPKELKVNVGDVIQNFDVEVIDNSGTAVPEDDYTMVWGSSAPGVVAVVGDRSQGIFDAVSEGEAIVRVYIKMEGYADMKGECTVKVTDPGKRAITSSDENVYIGQEFKVDGLTLTLGGWMFEGTVDGLKDKYGTTSDTFSKNACTWGKPSAGNNKPVGFTHNITMANQKNARQEFGSNCQPESYGIYDGTIKEQLTKVIDPMFNVPCYGAYFALAPTTTGTVTVYVRQNGVFDDATTSGKGVYRPQRRVFVMDEMGGHVTSTPKLEFPTGLKPSGVESLAKFDCDLLGLDDLTKDKDGNELTDAQISSLIKGHFVGLNTFEVSSGKITNFKNGVYASNLEISVSHNQAQKNHPTDVSARGWSVLSVAPVSYTFDVKPGKTYYIYNFGSKLGLYGFTFRKGTPTVDENTWSETETTPAIAKTEADHVAKVSIDRQFVPGVWNACVLPFSMNRQQIGEVFGACRDKNNSDGTEILYFDRVENGKIYFVRHAYNTIVAGKPFLIKPAKTGTIQIKSENMGDYPYVTIESTAAENFGKDKESADYYWTSSYVPFQIKPGDYFIRDFVDSNKPDKPATGNVVRYPKTQTDNYPMNGFRGYLTAKSDALRQSAKSLTIAISDFEDDETTYIENVEIAEDGTLRQRLSGKVYNLQGQLVSDDASQLNSLPKGIYIVNGKKVSVK